MNIIVSHDIDHLTASEHYFRDLIVPKHLARTKLEFLNGKISLTEVGHRYLELFRNKWHNLGELRTFNDAADIPNTFFIGVKNGSGLSYPLKNAVLAANTLLQGNCKVYLHGIHYASTSLIQQEKYLFENHLRIEAKGIRMHYVRKDESTLNRFAEAGFLFDSTMYEFRDPYKVGDMWEFPFQIMDGWVIEAGKRRQSKNLAEAQEETKRIIERAQQLNLQYFGIDFHDRYFSRSFSTWMNWYTWLITYLKEQGCSFTDFESSIQLLELVQPLERAVAV
jgi:hypothetical protein